MVAQCEAGYNEGHKGPRQARLAVSKHMLALLVVCFVIRFLGIMAYLIFGLAPCVACMVRPRRMCSPVPVRRP